MAKLIFNYSTMNAGKTIDLIRTIYNYEENAYSVILMKPEIDSKGDDCIVTRVGLKRPVDILIPCDCSIISLLKGRLNSISCIFIDEAQFLTEKQIDELFLISKSCDIPVICYGLRNNFKMEFFSGSKRLMEIADELNEFRTLCFCGEIARYCGRYINGEFTCDGDDILIDGISNVKYVPLCGKHYLEKVKHVNLDGISKVLKK